VDRRHLSSLESTLTGRKGDFVLSIHLQIQRPVDLQKAQKVFPTNGSNQVAILHNWQLIHIALHQ